MRYSSYIACILLACMTSVAPAQFVISSATDLFTPSIRGNANTTYFGWTSGNWDSNPGDETLAGELINNPPATINPAALGTIGLLQTTNADIVSGSNNLFTNTTANVGLTLTIPTAGSVGTGFTTIFIQGKGLASGQGLLNHVLYGDINGVSPTFVVGGNVFFPATTQWWAKYEIPGNAATYGVNITGAPGASNTFPISIADMIVDTSWSASGYAPDTAIVPEPGSMALLGLGGIAVIGSFGRRKNAK